MKAVLLAAGKGTRMKEITKIIPKPMVLIKGKPMLEYIVSNIKGAGITEFVIVIGYKQSIEQDYFKDDSNMGISITYIEQRVQDGTGAALHLTHDFIGQETFFFSFGDVITPPENYPDMLDYYRKTQCDALLGLNAVGDPYRGAAVYIDDKNTIVRIIEKPPKGTSTTNLTNAGIMILSPDIFQYTPRIKLSERGEYELTDVFSMMCDDGLILKGYELSGFWKDIGTPDDIRIAHKII